MCALHHRQKKELQEMLAALQASYAETRAEAAASYRLMVGGWVERGPAWPGWVAHLTEGIALSSNYSTMIAPPRAWCPASCTQNPQDLGCCFLSTSQLLPLLRCIQQPPCIPTPLHQEEELRNHATEGLNVTKLGLEGRIRELEGAVEAQHQVGGLAWAGGLGGWTAGNDLPISGRVVWCPAAFQPPSCTSLTLSPAELCGGHWGPGGSISRAGGCGRRGGGGHRAAHSTPAPDAGDAGAGGRWEGA